MKKRIAAKKRRDARAVDPKEYFFALLCLFAAINKNL
jgi:hypothetical protein